MEPTDRHSIDPGKMVEPVDGEIEVAEPGHPADATTGSVDESDDSDALEQSGTGKQSVHQ